MKNIEFLDKENKLLHCLQCIPKKMVGLHNNPEHEHDNLSEFVLYDLCNESCFDITKAAYFVNNPDFHCLKGIAGICRHEPGFCKGIKDIWQEPKRYADYMNVSPFNKKVRSIQRAYVDSDVLTQNMGEIARELGLERPECVQWHMKYGNNGMLLFEHGSACDELIKEYLPDTVYLLGFCPIH